jgi:hypothetical protein
MAPNCSSMSECRRRPWKLTIYSNLVAKRHHTNNPAQNPGEYQHTPDLGVHVHFLKSSKYTKILNVGYKKLHLMEIKKASAKDKAECSDLLFC